MPDPVAINYSRDVGWSGALIAELCRTEPSTVIVTFNYDHRPEIGTYHARLSEATFAQALAALRRSGYQGLAGPTTVPPETKFIVVGERQEGEPVPSLRSFDLGHLPAAIDPLAQAIETIIAGVRHQRTRVIEAAATWSKPAFTPHEPIRLDVVLRNVGTQPLTLGSPLGVPPGSWCGLRLFVRDASGDEQGVELDVSHLRPAKGAATDAFVGLAPAATLGFAVTKKVYLSPGQYAAALCYRNVEVPSDDAQFVEGEISMALAPLTIVEEASAR